MSATTLSLTIEPGALDARSSWSEFESLAVRMGAGNCRVRRWPGVSEDAQERLIDSVCGPRWAPVRGLPAPFGCLRCKMAEDFARKGKWTRKRKPHTAAGTMELVLWNVGCRDCGRVFAPLLIMLGLSGKRRTDRLTVEPPRGQLNSTTTELSRMGGGGTATSFLVAEAPSGRVSVESETFRGRQVRAAPDQCWRAGSKGGGGPWPWAARGWASCLMTEHWNLYPRSRPCLDGVRGLHEVYCAGRVACR